MSGLLAYFVICIGLKSVTSDDALNFVMLGDWGGQGEAPYYTKAEKEIAESMGSVAAQIDSQFTVAMGDNFYPDGVTDAYDNRFKTTFEVGKAIRVKNTSYLPNYFLHCSFVVIFFTLIAWALRSEGYRCL